MRERNVQIDLAKGIGIVLVVAGHCVAKAQGLIYLFHMPLFFYTLKADRIAL